MKVPMESPAKMKASRVAMLLLNALVEGMATWSCMTAWPFPGNEVSFRDYQVENPQAQALMQRGLGPTMAGTMAVFNVLTIAFGQTDNPLIWAHQLLFHGAAFVSFVLFPVFITGETTLTNYDVYAPDVRGLTAFHVSLLVFSTWTLVQTTTRKTEKLE